MKRTNNSLITKSLAFLLVIVSFGFAVTIFANLVMHSNGLESLAETNYANTNELLSYEQNFYIGLNNLLNLKNEEYIKQGNTIDKEEFENRKQDMFVKWYNGINEQMGQDYNGDVSIENKMGAYKLLKERFESECADEINEFYNSMVENDLKSYYSLLQKVNNKEGLYYYATNGENTYTNCQQTDRNYFTGFKAYYLSDERGTEVFPTSKDRTNMWFTSKDMDNPLENKIYIAASDEYLAKLQAEMNRQRIFLQNGITMIISALALLLIGFVYLLWKAGRKEDDATVHLMAIDKIYTDINVAMIFGLVLAWGAAFAGLIGSRFLNYAITDINVLKPDFWVLMLLNLICGSIALTLILSLVRHFKNGTLIKHSFTCAIIRKIKSTIKNIMGAGPLGVRIAGIILVCEGVVFILTVFMMSMHSAVALFWIMILFAISVWGIYYVIDRIKQFEKITKGVQEIKNGKLDYIIDIDGDNPLTKLAGDINTIADGLKNAVEKETKAERMKSELVTNVSHDLKTPLTSIINYVDLLSKEKLKPDVANEYVEVLKQKSEKLKLLTQDLFEISKVQSGNITIEVEKLDISVLVRQILAEFDEQITSSGLDFKTNIQENAYIMGDGNRLSRVFENLISNILKYSLKNTRVYIDVFANENNVIIEFKNIANYEMNFKEDEILERFVRGDSSRTTDGNGLGLAIAESYVEACGGKLQINIDGDLFKATIKFNKA